MFSELHTLDTGTRTLRKFGFLVGGVLIALGGVAVWRGSGAAPVLLVVGGLLAALGIGRPSVLRWPYVAWMALALTLGYVMTRVLLTVVYFVVVTPIGLGMRLARRDPMKRRPDPSLGTYWIPKEDDDDVRERLTRYY